MYFPTFRKKKNGVPVLSKGDIEVIAHNFVRDFQPEALTVPQELKMEEFIECYLGMTPDYQYLSHNGVSLGMTVFNDTDCVPVFCPETNRAEYIHADARTVIIDRRLIEDPKQEHRYRFTLGHEGGHDIFHTAFFAYDPNQTCMFTDAHPPMIQCRIDAGKSSKTDPRYWTDAERMEWQSNYFSSAFMMPSDTVKIVHARNAAKDPVYQNFQTITDMATTFNVSPEAALYRLRELKLIPKNDPTDYLNNLAYYDFIDFVC